MLGYQSAPKDLAGNLRWRRDVIAACARDKSYRRAIWHLCKSDILFWVNTFLFTYDPRNPPDKRVLPFITWKFQDETLLEVLKNLGICDIGIDKSRDMGASWMCLVAFLHQWQFVPYSSFML